MKRPHRDGTLDAALIMGVVLAGVSLALLAATLADSPPTALDRAVHRRLQRRMTKRRRDVVLAIGSPGYPGVYFPATALLIGLLRRRGIRGGEALAIASVGGWATHRFIKLFVRRRRPRTMRGRSNEFEAFPSGHTSATTAIALTTAHLLVRQGVAAPTTALAIGTLVSATVGTTRVLSDEHWMTDVIGGWIGGAGVAALSALAFEWKYD